MNLVLHPDNRLRAKAVPVDVFDDALEMFVNAMFDKMKADNGVGLAANQVGDNRAVAVVQLGQEHTRLVLINPIVETYSKKHVLADHEGCLSLPGERHIVPRTFSLSIKAQNLKGDWQTWSFRGLLARVVQHELDHLNGTLICDYNKESK